MKKLLVIAVILAFAVPCLAQTAQPAKPPEVQELGYLVGTWKLEAGKSTGTLACEWFKDVYVVCHEKTGESETLSVFSYDTEAKVYKAERYLNDGPPQQAQGSVKDKTMTFDFDVQGGDKAVKTRLTIVQESPTSAALAWGTKADAEAKKPSETVKATKVQ